MRSIGISEYFKIFDFVSNIFIREDSLVSISSNSIINKSRNINVKKSFKETIRRYFLCKSSPNREWAALRSSASSFPSFEFLDLLLTILFCFFTRSREQKNEKPWGLMCVPIMPFVGDFLVVWILLFYRSLSCLGDLSVCRSAISGTLNPFSQQGRGIHCYFLKITYRMFYWLRQICYTSFRNFDFIEKHDIL